MPQAEVRHRRPGETGRDSSGITVDDYRHALGIVTRLSDGIGEMTEEQLVRLDFDQDISQLSFHLNAELDHWRVPVNAGERKRLSGSLGFLGRHLRNLSLEFEDRIYRLLPAAHRQVLYRLHRITESRYRSYRHAYSGMRERRFLDKFYRDYCRSGIPQSVLSRLRAIARQDRYDRYIGILRGGLPYLVLLEAMGLPSGKIRHLACGRESGSHLNREFRFEPLDFATGGLKDRRILLIDNNLMSGKTLQVALRRLEKTRPASLSVLVDYVQPGPDGRLPDDPLNRLAGLLTELIIIRPASGYRSGRYRRASAQQLQTVVRGLKAVETGAKANGNAALSRHPRRSRH